jgi:hypothetical protein
MPRGYERGKKYYKQSSGKYPKVENQDGMIGLYKKFAKVSLEIIQ